MIKRKRSQLVLILEKKIHKSWKKKEKVVTKGKGFEGSGSGSGFWRVEGYKGFVKVLSNYRYIFLANY